MVGARDLQAWLHLHGAIDGPLRALVPRPAPARDAIVDIPVEHGPQAAFAVFASIDQHPEAAVHHLAPSDATAVVQADPRGATEPVADEVLDSHVCGERGAVVDVGGLAVRAVGPTHVVVVAAEHHWAFQTAILDGVVEGRCDFRPALGVCIQDAGLGAHHQLVRLGLSNPTQVVLHLLLDVRRRLGHQALKHVGGDAVRDVEVCRIAAAAHPAERPKSVVEAHGAHDVLDVRRVLEALTFRVHDVRAGTACFQQEGVPVIEEVRATGGVLVDRIRVTLQRRLDQGFELVRVFGHHCVGRLEVEAHGVIATSPWVVERRLV